MFNSTINIIFFAKIYKIFDKNKLGTIYLLALNYKMQPEMAAFYKYFGSTAILLPKKIIFLKNIL